MNFVADENVDAPIVEALRVAGHQVQAIGELAPSVDDETVLAAAARLGAALLTADTDFGELVFRQRRANHGVVLLRLAGLPSSRKAEIVVDAVAKHGLEMQQSFTVLASNGIRIRKV